jgi:hypothetical protein
MQVNSYSVVFTTGPVDHVPLVATAPFQPPEAVHAVTLSEFQLRVELPPLATVVGEAVSVTVGGVTTTSVDCEAEPAGPVHVKVYLVVAVRGSVVTLPLVGWEPLHPPEAVQL